MNTLETTKKILKQNNLIAKKGFGQNFLISDSILEKIVESAGVTANDTVIEIGPGLGNLTHYILEKGAKVIAFEIDEDMLYVLNDRFDTDRLKVINKDILKVDLNEYIEESKVKIIANLPYYITTPIIFELLSYRDKIESITVMIQKEVAERIMAKPHSKDYGVLTINTNYLADVLKIIDVPNTSFIPAPNVTSTVIQIIPNIQKEKELDIKNKEVFKEVVKKAFSARRKKLANSLYNSKLANMEKQEIDQMIESIGQNPNCRAEELEIQEYVRIANYIVENKQEKI